MIQATLYNVKRLLAHTSSALFAMKSSQRNSFTQEELQKYQELNNKNGVPNENTENLIETSKAPEENRYLK